MGRQGRTVVVAAGHHVAGSRIETMSLEELIFEASSAALRKAGLTADQLDSVVISGNDQTDGRIISCMVTAGACAGVGKNVTTVASAPEHAFAYAVLRLLAGQCRNVMVVGWSKPSESVSPEHAELVSADPFYVRPIGMNRVIAAALQASATSSPVHDPETSYLAWPLTADDCQQRADGACAIVLELRNSDDPRPGARVHGVGWAMDRYEIGDRDNRVAGGLNAATGLARSQAGPEFGPVDSVDVFAFGGPNERGLAGRAVTDLGHEGTRVFTSAEEDTPDFAAGLFTIWRAAERVIAGGRSGPAAAVVTSGMAAQGTTVVLLSDTTEV